jgi:predicted 3-demethylubiquinone-9 3-methyltransferase (glyoxalase superfamily)
MAKDFTPFLTFQRGTAGAAMDLYCSVFPNSRVEHVTRYGDAIPGPEGTVVTASFSLNGRKFLVADSPVEHDWYFTPAISIFVECESVAELETAFAKLGEGGRIYMPLDNYGFSQRFGWVGDRFGVTWQLNLS